MTDKNTNVKSQRPDRDLEYAIKLFYDKLEILDDKPVRKVIESILDYIKNTGNTHFLTYQPEVIEVLYKYWNFFSAQFKHGGYNFSGLILHSDEAGNIEYVILYLNPEFVSYISGIPLNRVKKIDERLMECYGLLPQPSEHTVALEAVDSLKKYCVTHKLIHFDNLFRIKMDISAIIDKEHRELEML